jgi:hypothetical protein
MVGTNHNVVFDIVMAVVIIILVVWLFTRERRD